MIDKTLMEPSDDVGIGWGDVMDRSNIGVGFSISSQRCCMFDSFDHGEDYMGAADANAGRCYGGDG